MATLSSPGIGSGLDIKTIVEQLVALERRPIAQLQAKTATIQTQLSSFGLLQSYTTNVRDIAARLAKPDFWTGNAATSSDSASVSISAGSNATAASYSVEVSQLARAQSLASRAYADTSTGLGTGTLRIEIGTWSGDSSSFQADVDKIAVEVPIAAGEDSLESIKNKINLANAGVTAGIVHDASGYRLTLLSTATGASSALRITAVDDDGIHTDELGLSALAFDPPNFTPGVPGAAQLSQTRSALNAQATINGLAISSASNTLTDVLDGVTLTLNKETTSAVAIKVAPDTATLKKAIGDFARAYSDINSYIAQQTKYDPVTKKSAALQGDRPTLTLQSTLRGAFLGTSSASAVYSRLSDVGLEIQSDGSMKVNDTKLSKALAEHPDEVARLFMNASPDDPAQQGFAVRIKDLASQLVDSDGAITSRTKGLRDSIQRNEKQQEALEARVALAQARLMRQYTALDTQLSQLNGIGSALSQSLGALANLNSSIANKK